MSIKIALIVIVPVVIITSSFSYYHYLHERKAIFLFSETQLLHIGEGLKGSAEAFLKNEDNAGLQQLVQQTALEADIEQVTLFGRQGTVAACNYKQHIGKNFLDLFPAEMTQTGIKAVRKGLAGGYAVYYDPDDMQYCLVMPLGLGKENAGAVFVSLDLKSTQAQIGQRALVNLLLSLLGTALMGITIYFFLHSLFAGRVKSVASAAVRLASGNTTARAQAGGTDEIAYLATSFNVLAEEITNWRTNLEAMVAGRVQELTALYNVSQTISRSLDLATVLPRVLDNVLEALGERRGVIVLVGEEGEDLKLMGNRGLSMDSVRCISLQGQGCISDAVLKNSPVRVGGTGDGEISVPGLEREEILSALAVPISARCTAFGAVAVYSGKKDRFSESDEELLVTIGNQVAVAVENARLYEKTLEMAQEDGLTGLSNRRHLMEMLHRETERTARYNTAFSVLILDLDKFKSFNDTYGHLKGDELLRAFADLMKKSIRTTDVAGRYGGEEFCVILPNTALKGALVIAERIRSAFASLRIPMGEGSPPAGATVSIGIAELVRGETEEKLLGAADAALYRAKKDGRNRVAW